MLSLQQVRELRALISSERVTVQGNQAMTLVGLIAALDQEEQVLLSQEEAHRNLQQKVARIRPKHEVEAE